MKKSLVGWSNTFNLNWCNHQNILCKTSQQPFVTGIYKYKKDTGSHPKKVRITVEEIE